MEALNSGKWTLLLHFVHAWIVCNNDQYVNEKLVGSDKQKLRPYQLFYETILPDLRLSNDWQLRARRRPRQVGGVKVRVCACLPVHVS